MARSSMYGSIASMIPKWVFGGDYGDISNELNQRELSYENLDRVQLDNDQAQIDLQRKQRAQEINDMLAQQFQEQRPASMRDAYVSAIDAAFNVGDVDTALKYQGAVEKLDELTKQQKYESLKDAASLAQMFDYDRVNEAMPGVLSPQEASRIYSESRRRGQGGSGVGGKERSFEFVDENGIPRLVPASQYNAAADMGWKRAKGTNPLDDILQQMLGDAAPDEAQSVPGEEPARKQKALVDGIKQDAEELRVGGRRQISSGDIAPSNMTIRNPETGMLVTIKKGQRIP